MTETAARSSIVNFNLRYNGWGDGHGYPGLCPNPADVYLGRPCEYSCADGITFACKHQGYPLPKMQTGLATGFAYCPSGLDFAKARGATIPSWKAQPADFIFIYTGSGAQPGHVEMVYAREGDTLYSFGWDSGPSNVDHFQGQGGCHKHAWHDPVGVGNNAIITAVDLSKLVHLPNDPIPTPRPAPPNPSPHPLLMLKTPLMGTPKGWDIIRQVQVALNHHGARLVADGIYGPHAAAAVKAFQQRTWPRDPRQWDEIVGPQTYAALGIR